MTELTGFPIAAQQRWLWHNTQHREHAGSCTLRMVLARSLEAIAETTPTHRLQQLVQREEILRTRLTTVAGMNEPLQVIDASGCCDLQQEDWRPLDDSAVAHKIAQWDAEERNESPPPQQLQLTLCALSDQRTLVRLRAPDTLVDSTSLMLIATELFAPDHAGNHQHDVLQFADYAAWRNSLIETSHAGDNTTDENDGQPATLHPGIAYWQQQAQSRPPSFQSVLIDRPATGNRPAVMRMSSLPLGTWDSDTLAGIANSLEATPEETLFTLWAAWLARLSANSELTIGCFQCQREDELRDAIGPYAYPLPLTVPVALNGDLRTCLQALRGPRLEALGWKDYNTGEQQTDLSFRYQSLDDHPVLTRHADTVCLRHNVAALLHLDCQQHRGALHLTLHFDGERLTDLAAQCLVEQWQQWLAAIQAQPQRPLQEISLLGPVQQSLFHPQGDDFPWQPKALPTLIEEQAQRCGDAPAVAFQSTTLSYRQLNQRANQLARYLLSQGTVKEDIIAIYLPRSEQLLVAILAVMKAGAAYLPLDITYPRERVKQILVDSGAQKMFIDDDTITALDEQATPDETTIVNEPFTVESEHLQANQTPSGQQPLSLMNLTRISAELDQYTDTNLPPPALPDLAYVIYTSGSTGRPKGVAITHGNLSYSTQARAHFYRTPVQAYLLLSSVAFDSSVAGIFWTLMQGGCLVLPAAGEELEPRQLAALIRRHQVSHSLCLPSLYDALLDQTPLNDPADEPSDGPGDLAADELASLQAWIVAGESCPPTLVTKHRQRLHDSATFHARLFNEYGPSEATVWATVETLVDHQGMMNHKGRVDGVPIDTDPPTVTIGRPTPGMDVWLITSGGVLAAIGEPGEIYLSGPQLARGYLNQPQSTAARFGPHPALPEGQPVYRSGDRGAWRIDGRLDFLGRCDNQVKIRGHRVELDEIERLLNEHQDIAAAAVITADLAQDSGADVAVDSSDDKAGAPNLQLLAYFVPRHGYVPDSDALRRYLADHLPPYMQPQALISLPELPRGPNGKLDRQRLPRHQGVTGEYVAPRNPVEQQLAAICAQVLRRPRVGVHDNFFHLGGDSILSLQVVTRALQQGIQLSAKQIFESQTVAGMAALAQLLEPAPTAAAEVSDNEPLLDLDDDAMNNLLDEISAAAGDEIKS